MPLIFIFSKSSRPVVASMQPPIQSVPLFYAGDIAAYETVELYLCSPVCLHVAGREGLIFVTVCAKFM
jgi:hypothetical protein